jgi:hypothetical protein
VDDLPSIICPSGVRRTGPHWAGVRGMTKASAGRSEAVRAMVSEQDGRLAAEMAPTRRAEWRLLAVR